MNMIDRPDAAGTAALLPISFSSSDVAPGEALDMWLHHFGRLNHVIPARDSVFAARVDYWRLARIAMANTRSTPSRLVRTSRQARSDGFDHWVLRVSRRGVVRSRSGDRTYCSRPGELVLERLTEPYEDDWDADEWVGAMVAPGVYPAIDRALESIPTGPVPGVRAALLADYLLALDRRLPSMVQADIDAVADATQAMIVALSPDARAGSAQQAKAARIRAEHVIRANLGSARLDSRRVAQLAGLSRSALYRLFEDSGGVAAHIRKLRLDTVRAALADPARRGEPIASIAGQSGFHCAASFSRAFKARFGATPGEMRGESGGTPGSEKPRMAGRDFLDVLFAGA